MTLGFRTAETYDPNLIEVYGSFERWTSVAGKFHTMLLDLYPPLRNLPDLLVPLRKYAKAIREEERDFFLGHWNSIKKKIEQETAQVCRYFPIVTLVGSIYIDTILTSFLALSRQECAAGARSKRVPG
jgi:hypothetical protein